MSKKILIVLSEWGFWGEELLGPLDAFDAAQYEVTFVTPKGRRPVPLSASMDPNFIDPPLGRPVVTREIEGRAAIFGDGTTAYDQFWSHIGEQPQ